MRRRLPPDTNVDDLEHAFYEAMHKADLDALMACWADDDEVICVHPGGQRLIGLAAIRASFAEAFSHGNIPVQPEQVRRVQGAGYSVHSVLERLDVVTGDGHQVAHVMATNVYARTPKGWRLVAHHASPGELDEQGKVQQSGTEHTLH